MSTTREEKMASAAKLYMKTVLPALELCMETVRPAWKLYEETVRFGVEALRGDDHFGRGRLMPTREQKIASAGKLYMKTCSVRRGSSTRRRTVRRGSST